MSSRPESFPHAVWFEQAVTRMACPGEFSGLLHNNVLLLFNLGKKNDIISIIIYNNHNGF